MSDKGIIFAAPMVRALLDGRKTQTRRLCAWANNPLSPALSYIVPCDEPGWFGDEEGEVQFRAPYAPGDRLYVREAHGFNHYEYERGRAPKTRPDDLDNTHLSYLATEDDCEIRQELRYRPSIHMPRWASRLTLAVEEVRVQRLQDISEADAIAEGLIEYVLEGPGGLTLPAYHWRPNHDDDELYGTAVAAYRALWDTLHTAEGERWQDNPWIVAVTFDVRAGNIDAEAA